MKSVDSSYYRTSARAPSQQLAVSQFVSKTYGWMFVGLLLTGLVSLWVASSEAAIQIIFGNRFVFYGILIGELGLVMGLSAAYQRLSATGALLGFLAYSALSGVTFSSIFLVYTYSSIGHIFLIAAGMFGGLALVGTVTKKDLTGLGAFVGMGVWGLILVGLVNLFVQSESLSLGLSAAGVLIFSGLTAYDAQRVRSLAYQYAYEGNSSRGEAGKGAVFAALTLYLNFINLFLSLLRLFGNRRN
jgi:FtsH-binding integral membrane protein